MFVRYEDMTGDVDSRKFTSWYLIAFLGSCILAIKLQKYVAFVNYWSRILCELGHVQDEYVVKFDNQSAIHIAKNPIFHSHSKHIDIHHHRIMDVRSVGREKSEVRENP